MLKWLFFFFVLFHLHILAIAQNYDESKVPAYSLPPVLEMEDGSIVKNTSSWENKRKPEILRLFEDHVYGQMPNDYDSIQFTLTNESSNAMNGNAHLKEIILTIFRNKTSINIPLILFIPNKVKKPVPAFLFINNRNKENTDPTRSLKSEFWSAEMAIENGYAIAAFHVDDAAPDNNEAFRNGVLQLYPEQLEAANGMRAIGAWAWAASRVLDFFQQDKDIDANKVAIVGHSRGGKAALWAGAQDQRFAMVISNNSGNSGTSISRRNFGETVKNINERFPYWFNDNYKKYNENENALPVDQHMLIGLMAPRPIYVTNASEDLWADPKGSYLALVHAQKVYKLYQKHPRIPSEPPAINQPIIKSVMGYHNREGIHDLTAYDWYNFIQFADHHFK